MTSTAKANRNAEIVDRLEAEIKRLRSEHARIYEQCARIANGMTWVVTGANDPKGLGQKIEDAIREASKQRAPAQRGKP